MLRLFLATFVFGALLTLLVARLYPLPDSPRLRSESIALANGGREEVFYMRLPDDRLGSPRAASVAPFPTQSFARNGKDRILAELFRVRDGAGHIIGLASKMSGDVAASAERAQQNVDWMLMIPSRGAMVMSTEGLPADKERNYPVGRMGLDPMRSGLILFGTQEFSSLTGFFIEEADIDHVDENGQAHGVLKLRLHLQNNSQ